MNTLFLKLLNMSAAGSVLILAVVVLRALLKRAPRWIICAMWALAAIRLICPVSIISPLSAFQVAPSIISENGEVEVFRFAGGSEKPLLAVETVQIERPGTSSETIREISGTPYAVTQRSRGAYLPPLVQAYLLGLTAMLLYAMVSTLLLRRKVSISLRQRGNIRVCDEAASPFILGIFRPVIYLPSSLSEEEKRFVLAHERAHLHRFDHIWKPLGFLILSLHWFNPFCWLGYVLLCRDIELACDERVIRELGRAQRAAYSQTLLNCSAHRVLAACPVAFGETDVKRRVRAVLNYKKPGFWIVLAAVLGCIVLIVCFAADPVQEQDLSFLNYKNAIPLIGQSDTAPYAVWYPENTSAIRPGAADSKELIRYLGSARWTQRRSPGQTLPSPGSVEFIIEDDYRITVYQKPRLAVVRSGDERRYYRTRAGDYEAALAVFLPAPSTEPDLLPPEPSPEPISPEPEALGGYDRSYWAEVERELASFAHPEDTDIYLFARFDTDIPADALFGPLTLEDYIYGSDAWTFRYNGPQLANDPEASILLRDADGRTLRIMSDADALMIQELDGSVTWASYRNAPMDCADMIRHLLPWAQGKYPAEEETAARKEADAQKVFPLLGHFTLDGMEPLQEEAGTALPYWAEMMDSSVNTGSLWATAYFGTEEMSADLRYARMFWNGDPDRPMGERSFSLCRETFAASGGVTDLKVGAHDAFVTDISGLAGRRLVWYDAEKDLLFSLIAAHFRDGIGDGSYSVEELVALAESAAAKSQQA